MPDSSPPPDRRSVVLAYGFIAACLCVACFHMYADILSLAGHDINTTVFTFLDRGIDTYRDRFPPPWKPRFFANALAWLVVADAGEETAQRIALWNVLWLAATCAVLLTRRRNLSLFLFGLFVALPYAYSPGTGRFVYPWDMPALFFVATAVILFERRLWRGLVVLPAIGVGFKETTALCGLFLLFLRGHSRRRRIVLTAVSLAGAGLVRLALHLFTRTEIMPPMLTSTAFTDNIRTIFSASLNHVAFVNGGMLVVALLLPLHTQTMWACKTILVSFCCGTILLGRFNEYRIFIELMPVLLLYLAEWTQPEGATSRPRRATGHASDKTHGLSSSGPSGQDR